MLLTLALFGMFVDSDETAQIYSTFTTNYRPPAAYEHLLGAASKFRSQATKAFERRETFETAIVRFYNATLVMED